jgi:hypothetical protein
MKWYSGENLPRTHARPTTFSEAWLHQRYGLEFGKRCFMDPLFRTEQDRQAHRLLYVRFGSLGLGQKDPSPQHPVSSSFLSTEQEKAAKGTSSRTRDGLESTG